MARKTRPQTKVALKGVFASGLRAELLVWFWFFCIPVMISTPWRSSTCTHDLSPLVNLQIWHFRLHGCTNQTQRSGPRAQLKHTRPNWLRDTDVEGQTHLSFTMLSPLKIDHLEIDLFILFSKLLQELVIFVSSQHKKHSLCSEVIFYLSYMFSIICMWHKAKLVRGALNDWTVVFSFIMRLYLQSEYAHWGP